MLCFGMRGEAAETSTDTPKGHQLGKHWKEPGDTEGFATKPFHPNKQLAVNLAAERGDVVLLS